jgi:hypothetical protein
VSTTWQTVHVRVNDAATGQPTPVRIRITGPDGEYFPPLGRLTQFATGRNQDVGGNVLLGMRPHAYVDGTCEVRLPAGPLTVDIRKGFEFTPLRQEVVLKPGQLSLRFTLERWINLRADGWYSGDTRAHFLSPHAALLEGAAEDLAVVNLLATECRAPGSHGKDYPAVPNLLAFSGQTPALQTPDHMVVVNTHNIHPVLGSLGLLNCHRVVYPLRFGGPDGRDDWALADWCDQCHRKGGLVVWTCAWNEGEDFAFGEPLADLILGKIDAFEIDFFEDSPFDTLPDWYALLAAGLRVPLAGASGKDSNGVALGSMRTYARLRPGEEMSYRNWVEAVRAGRTFITNGPLLAFTVDGREPGDFLEIPADRKVRVRAEGRSAVPFDRVEVVVNGAVPITAEASGTPSFAILETDLSLPESSWLAARCRGEQQVFHRPANQRVFAHTSPVYVKVAGRTNRPEAVALARLVGPLERGLEWVRREARCDNDSQREHLAGIFQDARDLLRQRGG